MISPRTRTRDDDVVGACVVDKIVMSRKSGGRECGGLEDIAGRWKVRVLTLQWREATVCACVGYGGPPRGSGRVASN